MTTTIYQLKCKSLENKAKIGGKVSRYSSVSGISAEAFNPMKQSENVQLQFRLRDRTKITNQLVDKLLQVDDLEYKHQIQKQVNTSKKVPNVLVIKRDMIPALPSRHGSRADSIVPIHSQARLKAEKILSKANEFRALFEDEDFSILDKCDECDIQFRKESSKKESLSHSMTMNVWRANKVNSTSPNQSKSRCVDELQFSKTLHSTPTNEVHQINHLKAQNLKAQNSFCSDDSIEPSSYRDSWMHETSKCSVANETLPQCNVQITQKPNMRIRNDQISDALLHNAIMNDVVKAMQQTYCPQSNPYVSLVDIKFAVGSDIDRSSDGSLTHSKLFARSGLLEPRSIADTLQRKPVSNKNEKRSKKTKAKSCDMDIKNSPDSIESMIDDARFQLESPFAVHVLESSSCVQGQKMRESPKLPPVNVKGRMHDAQHHQFLDHPSQKMNDLKSKHSLAKTKFELIGLTIATEENVVKMESREVLFETIERNVAERIEICSNIDRACVKLQQQWQAKQKTLLCQSNTRLQGSARYQLLTFLRSLRDNQNTFLSLALRCSAFGGESSGMTSITYKIARWKQEIDHHMHELVRLPTVADVINEIAIEGNPRSNSFKSSIGIFPGCSKIDLATASACSKLLLGSKDCKTKTQIDTDFFGISGNNVAPSNGQISSIMLSPCEPQEAYKQVGF